VLAWTAGYLAEHRMQSPRLEAELLLGHVLARTRVQLYLAPDQPLTSGELSRFKGHVGERLKGRPVAHITGCREFWKNPFRTPPGVFVPRPETELVVEQVLKRFPRDRAFSILDLCTGSGNIPVSVLVDRPGARGQGVDISALAVETATANAQDAGVGQRAGFACEDAVSFLERNHGGFDVITCNPPYVRSADWARLQPDVRDYEPRAAVDGGHDGLGLIRALIPRLSDHLVDDGLVLLEYDGGPQTATVEKLLAGEGFVGVAVLKDLAGQERVMAAGKGAV